MSFEFELSKGQFMIPEAQNVKKLFGPLQNFAIIVLEKYV